MKSLRNLLFGAAITLGVYGCGDSLIPAKNVLSQEESVACDSLEIPDCREGYSFEVSCGYNNSGRKNLSCIDGKIEEGECFGAEEPSSQAEESTSPITYNCPEVEECLTVECPEEIPLMYNCPEVEECPEVTSLEVSEYPTIEYPTTECPEEFPTYACESSSVQKEYQVLACGLNNRGQTIEERVRACSDGIWREWSDWSEAYSCLDPDDCVEGSEQIIPCGINGSGSQRQRCDLGQYMNSDVCEDNAICLDAKALETIPCGERNEGMLTIGCSEGNLTFSECVYEPSECILGEEGICGCLDNDCDGTIDCCDLEGKILFDGGEDTAFIDLFVMNANSCNKVNLTHTSQLNEYSASWSPDGTKIAFVCEEEDRNLNICLMNADGTERRKLTNNPESYRDLSPQWSPDGEQIAFFSGRSSGTTGIYLVKIDGSEPERQLALPFYLFPTASGRYTDSFISWSPDGSKMAFSAINWYAISTAPDIYVINVDGTNLHNLSNDPSPDAEPAWSPDGTSIAFACERAGNYDICIMNSDGSEQRTVTTHVADDYHPVWSPDGRKINFTSYRNNVRYADLFVINTDGSDERNITATPEMFEGNASWKAR